MLRILPEVVEIVCLLATKTALYQYNVLIHIIENPQNSPLFFVDVKRGGGTVQDKSKWSGDAGGYLAANNLASLTIAKVSRSQ